MDHNDDNLSQVSESIEVEQELIQDFQKMLIRPTIQTDTIIQDLQKLNMQCSKPSISMQIFAFLIYRNQQPINWSSWLKGYLQQIKVLPNFELFSKPKNQYIIVKLQVSQDQATQLITHVKQHLDQQNGICCIFKPSFYLDTVVSEQIYKIEQNFNDHITVLRDGIEKKVYMLGHHMQEQESEILEYKNYKIAFMLSHRGYPLHLITKDTLMKHVCSFLNQGFSYPKSEESDIRIHPEGKVKIGVGMDKKFSKSICQGVKCSQRKVDQFLLHFNDGLNLLKIAPKVVQIEACLCGIAASTLGEVHIYDNIRIFEVTIQPSKEALFSLKQGYYHYRSASGIRNIPLTTLYDMKLSKKISEEDFVAALSSRDDLEEAQKLHIVQNTLKKKQQTS